MTVIISLVYSNPLVASPAVGSLPDPATPQLPSNNHLSSPAEGTLPDPVTLQLPSITHLTTPAVGNLPNPAMLQLPTINHLVEPPIPQILPSSQEHQPVAIGELTSPYPRKVGKENRIGASYMSSWVNFSSTRP